MIPSAVPVLSAGRAAEGRVSAAGLNPATSEPSLHYATVRQCGAMGKPHGKNRAAFLKEGRTRLAGAATSRLLPLDKLGTGKQKRGTQTPQESENRSMEGEDGGLTVGKGSGRVGRARFSGEGEGKWPITWWRSWTKSRR